MIWGLTANDTFSVKSAYNTTMSMKKESLGKVSKVTEQNRKWKDGN